MPEVKKTSQGLSDGEMDRFFRKARSVVCPDVSKLYAVFQKFIISLVFHFETWTLEHKKLFWLWNWIDLPKNVIYQHWKCFFLQSKSLTDLLAFFELKQTDFWKHPTVPKLYEKKIWIMALEKQNSTFAN